MLDDQFVFSSSWLPSSRLELRTLADYTYLPPLLIVFGLIKVFVKTMDKKAKDLPI